MLIAKKIINGLATLGPVGYFPFAEIITLFLSIPMVMAVNAVVFALHTGTGEEQALPRSVMMINRVFGLLLAFSGISLNVKLLVVGCLFFLATRHFLPRLLLKYAEINLTTWPAVVHLLVIDCTAGMFVNFVFRFIFWLVAMPR